MRLSLTILLLMAMISGQSQTKWSIYLEDIDSAYESGVTRLEQDGSLSYRYFSGYRLVNSFYDHSSSDKTNRVGVVLPAKSTKYHTILTEAKVYDEYDSILVKIINEYTVVRHGRSATLSVLNAFSKKENRIKQDSPSEEIHDQRIEGTIYHDQDSFNFTRDEIIIDNNKYRITGLQRVVKNKNGKIKTAVSTDGLQVMRHGRCVAAIYYAASPQEYYLDKSLTGRERLVLMGWLAIRDETPMN